MDKAFITGITGQDGSYLADLLLSEGLEVYGLIRRKASASNWRIHHLAGHERMHLVNGDLMDVTSLTRSLQQIRPKYVFNLAAQSFVPFSWEAPEATSGVTAIGVLNMLEAVRMVDPAIRFYQASSSEMFGKVRETPQKRTTPFYPRSPYGVSKVYGHWMTINYRESYDMYACSGILFNHESERRGLEFVTRKVTWAAANIKRGKMDSVSLGNLDAQRDWGYAPDYVQAMWLMLNRDEPRDYVIATGEQSSVRELCDTAFSAVGLNYEDHVKIDPRFLRPAEVNTLLGDIGEAREQLNWQPATSFRDMITKMVEADLHRVDNNITWET
ncbi:GDP-mannose 4,6-dehydratase [bacterium]|nr:GDP-mannose 4,6-dehydratase [bacterium]